MLDSLAMSYLTKPNAQVDFGRSSSNLKKATTIELYTNNGNISAR